VVAKVRATFERYETALNANDVDVLDASFWNDPRVIRYSLVDNAYAFEAIHASRPSRRPIRRAWSRAGAAARVRPGSTGPRAGAW
jgi:hypothetical protein